jgi:hypothetical protein
MSNKIEGIYTAYMSGIAGQGLGMFVFSAGKIAGADIAGLTFSGDYSVENDRVVGKIQYKMPKGSMSITGMVFENASSEIVVPIELPVLLDEKETYRIQTPIGPVNVKFVKNVEFEANDAN